MGVVARLSRLLLDLLVILTILIALPGIPPQATFSSYKVELPYPLDGVLSINTKLDGAERLFEGRINGPESIASRKPDEIFVSLHGGKIMQIWGKRYDHFKMVTSIGPGCAGHWEEEICGRPLGLRFAPDGKLLVADAYLGLFSVDVDTGEKELLLDAQEPINGTIPLLIDDLDIDADGIIYFTDASTISNLANGVVELLADPTGRLLKYDTKTKIASLLLPKIHFANGVQLSPDHSFVLVCETFRSRVIRYWLSGPKAGKSDIFVDRLPGMPDNIRTRPQGGYFVSLVSVRKQTEKPDFIESLRGLPWIRKLLSRLLVLTRLIFDYCTKFFPNDYTAKISYNILNLHPIATLLGYNHTIIVEVGEDGKIVGSLQGVTGKLMHISETHQIGDHIFFGSPYNMYLGHLFIGEDSPLIDADGDGVKVTDLGDDRIRITIGGDGAVPAESLNAKEEL